MLNNLKKKNYYYIISMHYLMALGDLIKLYQDEDDEVVRLTILQILQETKYMSIGIKKKVVS
jgi:hypothetical protein